MNEPSLRAACLALLRSLTQRGHLAHAVRAEMEAVRDAVLLDPRPEPAVSARLAAVEAELAELRVSVVNLMRTVEAGHRPPPPPPFRPVVRAGGGGDEIPF